MLEHTRTGNGPPIVLLHGIGMDRSVWDPVVPLLAPTHEVVAVDLPGFGASAPLAREPTVEALAEAMETLDLDRVHVAGNSLGGGIALELGRRGWAGSVCAISPIGFAAGRERAYSRATLNAIHAMARRLDGGAGTADATPARRVVLMSLIVARPANVAAPVGAHWNRATARCPGWSATLPAVTSWRPVMPACPTTIAWAEHDRLLLAGPPAPRARRWLPDARHVTLHGCGHVPMWDDPEQVARAIADARA